MVETGSPFPVVSVPEIRFPDEDVGRVADKVLGTVRARGTLDAAAFADEEDLDLLLVIQAFTKLVLEGKLVEA